MIQHYIIKYVYSAEYFDVLHTSERLYLHSYGAEVQKKVSTMYSLNPKRYITLVSFWSLREVALTAEQILTLLRYTSLVLLFVAGWFASSLIDALCASSRWCRFVACSCGFCTLSTKLSPEDST